MLYGQGAEAKLIDFHFAHCHADYKAGGMHIAESARVIMVRGSVTGCTVKSTFGGGAEVRGFATLSLIDTWRAQVRLSAAPALTASACRSPPLASSSSPTFDLSLSSVRLTCP